MTPLLTIYARVWEDLDDDDETTSRGQSIIRCMEAIRDAPDLDAAVAAVSWWGESGPEGRRRVARARKMLKAAIEPRPTGGRREP